VKLTITITSASFYDNEAPDVPPADALLVVTDLEARAISPTDQALIERGGQPYFGQLQQLRPFTGRRVVPIDVTESHDPRLPFGRIYFVPEPSTHRLIDTALFSGLCTANKHKAASVIIAPVQSELDTGYTPDKLEEDGMAMIAIAEGLETFVATVSGPRLNLKHIQVRTGSEASVGFIVDEMVKRLKTINMTNQVLLIGQSVR
jgi:hypothetical protein